MKALVIAAAMLLSAHSPVEASSWHRDYVTWFGPGFYGNRTACGQKMSRWLKGVAHRTLPCGTMVSFRYRGRTATVPVVDRGPYGVPGLDFDLTARTMCWQLTGGRPKDCSSKWVYVRIVG